MKPSVLTTSCGKEKESDPRSGADFVVNASRIGTSGGLRTYTLAVLECLKQLYGKVEVVFPGDISGMEDFRITPLPGWLGSSPHVSRLRPVVWFVYCALAFPVRRRRRLFSTTHHVVPFRRRQIVTVHDLRPYYLPDTWIQRFYFHHLLPRALRKCDGIITVSENSKRDLISTYGLLPETIHIVPNAICFSTCSAPGVALGNAHPYLLMVGASWPHKNAKELLERHTLWTERYMLKIVAGRGQYAGYLRSLCAELGIADRVEFFDRVSDCELQALYKNCSALVYPSQMEGFGIPPLEAMAHGRPVIVSDIPVFRELFGDVPFYVQLGNQLSWVAALNALGSMAPEEDERRKAGRTLAAGFSLGRMCNALAAALPSIWGRDLISATESSLGRK